MPIKGLTDSVRPAFPRLGKLRKGAPKESDKKPGEDLDHFRFTSKQPEVEAAFKDAYGDDPQEMIVYLPYAKLDDNFGSWKEAWVQGGLQHRCDGETMQIWLGKDGKYHQDPQPCTGGCEEVGRLEVILLDLFRAGYVGYVTLETHSIHDLLSIQGALLATIDARGAEDLRGIGFVLRRVEQEISTPGPDGKRVRRKKWLVKLQPAAQWVSAQLEAARVDAVALLESGDESEPDVIEGEVTEHESSQPEPPKAEPPKTEPPKTTRSRPYDADTIAEGVRGKSAKHKGSKAPAEHAAIAALEALIAQAIANTDLDLPATALTMVAAAGRAPENGLNGLTAGDVAALYGWLAGTGKTPGPYAQDEVINLLAHPQYRKVYEQYEVAK